MMIHHSSEEDGAEFIGCRMQTFVNCVTAVSIYFFVL